MVDCVDYENSEIQGYESGAIMRFKKYVIHKELLQGIHIFKIPDLRNSEVFVSEEFVNRVQENQLEGFEFIEI